MEKLNKKYSVLIKQLEADVIREKSSEIEKAVAFFKEKLDSIKITLDEIEIKMKSCNIPLFAIDNLAFIGNSVGELDVDYFRTAFINSLVETAKIKENIKRPKQETIKRLVIIEMMNTQHPDTIVRTVMESFENDQ